MKLGEMLLEKGLLKASQLDMALKTQLILGGHLGTCLVEMGLLDEDTLGRVLSESIGIPYAPASLFEDVPESAIQVVPGRIAEEYQIVPLKIADRGVLHLAMIDPRNLPNLDDISFALGRRFIPWIAPEIRVFQALERYYGIPRRPRYITICREIDEKAAAKKSQESVAGAVSDTEGPNGSARASSLSLASPDNAALTDAAAADRGIAGEPEDPAWGYGRSWREVADRMAAAAPTAGAEPPIVDPGKPGPPADRAFEPIALDQAAQRICQAETQTALGETVTDFCTGRMKRVLMFRVSGIRAQVWQVRGVPFTDEMRTSSFGVTSEGIFNVLQGLDHYRGPLPECEGKQGVYRRLSLDLPAEIVLVPVHIDDRLVAILLGDGGPEGRIQGTIDEVLRMVRLFGLGMKLLLLKRKIRESVFTPSEHAAEAAGRKTSA